MSERSIRRMAQLVGLVSVVSTAHAGTVGLAWSPVAGAAGYRVYYGTAPGSYSASKDVGAVTQTALAGLDDCTDYYLAVKAYNSLGESESFSNEIAGWARPSIEAPSPASRLQGARSTLQIVGANFRPGAVVTVDNPRVRIEGATYVGCGRIDLAVALDPDAPGLRAAETGSFAVTVSNPDGTYGARDRAFEVAVDPSRFDVNRSTDSTRGRVDGADTVWLARLFSSRDGVDALYDPDFDIDGNGWIDGDDLSFVALNIGKCWSGTGWSADACSASSR